MQETVYASTNKQLQNQRCIQYLQTFKMRVFVKFFNGFNPITVNIWQHPKYFSKNVSFITGYFTNSPFFSPIRRLIWGWKLDVSLIGVWSQCQKIVKWKTEVRDFIHNFLWHSIMKRNNHEVFDFCLTCNEMFKIF